MNKNARRAYTGYAVLAALVALLLRIGSKVPDPTQGSGEGEGQDTTDPGENPMPGPIGDPTDLPTLDPQPAPEPISAPDDPALDPDPSPSPNPISWFGHDSGTAADPGDSTDVETSGNVDNSDLYGQDEPAPDMYDADELGDAGWLTRNVDVPESDLENLRRLYTSGAVGGAGAGAGALARSGLVKYSGKLFAREGTTLGRAAASAGIGTLPSGMGELVSGEGLSDELDWENRDSGTAATPDDSTDVETTSGIDWSNRDSGTAADTDTSDVGSSDDDDDGTTWAWESGGYDSGTAADPGDDSDLYGQSEAAPDMYDPGSEDDDEEQSIFGGYTA